jgi:hypothetical protein
LSPSLIDNKYEFIESTIYANSENQFSYGRDFEYWTAIWIYENTHKNWKKRNIFTWDEHVKRNSEDVLAVHPPPLRGRAKFVEPFNDDTLIISDPYTMFMLGSLTGRDIFLYNRVWIEESSYSPEVRGQMDFLKNIVFKQTNNSLLYDYILENRRNHTELLIVISDRTSEWLKRDNHFITFPRGKIDKSLFTIFNDSKYFSLVYKIDDKIYVFKANLDVKKEVYS